jgi:hypothetical protein
MFLSEYFEIWTIIEFELFLNLNHIFNQNYSQIKHFRIYFKKLNNFIIWTFFNLNHFRIWTILEFEHFLIWTILEFEHFWIWTIFEFEHFQIGTILEFEHFKIWTILKFEQLSKSQVWTIFSEKMRTKGRA